MSVRTMIEAAGKGDLATLRKLLDPTTSGMSPDIADKDGWTPLHEAALRNQEAAMTVLLDNGAKTERAGGLNWLPLHLCARDGFLTCVQLLLDRGAEINAIAGPEEADGAAIHFAAGRGHTGIVTLLIERRADVNLRNGYGETALMRAAYGGHMAVVKKLLKAKANRKLKGKQGWSRDRQAWMLARMEGYHRVGDLLQVADRRRCAKLKTCLGWY